MNFRFLVLVAATLFAGTAHADATGDTYSYGANAFTNTFATAQVVNEGTATVGTTEMIGPSLFGNPGDTMELTESTTGDAANGFSLVIDVVARDSGSELTNWFADGSTHEGQAIRQVSFHIATGPGFGTVTTVDPIEPSMPFNTIDRFTDTSIQIFTTAGDILTTGATFQFVPDGDQISGIASLNPFPFGTNGDLSTQVLGGSGEFAGFRININYTTIPEPTAASILGLVGLGIHVRRRRR